MAKAKVAPVAEVAHPQYNVGDAVEFPLADDSGTIMWLPATVEEIQEDGSFIVHANPGVDGNADGDFYQVDADSLRTPGSVEVADAPEVPEESEEEPEDDASVPEETDEEDVEPPSVEEINQMTFNDLTKTADQIGIKFNPNERNIFKLRKVLKDALGYTSNPVPAPAPAPAPAPKKAFGTVARPPVVGPKPLNPPPAKVGKPSNPTPKTAPTHKANKREVLAELLLKGGTVEEIGAEMDKRCGGSQKENRSLVKMFGDHDVLMGTLVMSGDVYKPKK